MLAAAKCVALPASPSWKWRQKIAREFYFSRVQKTRKIKFMEPLLPSGVCRMNMAKKPDQSAPKEGKSIQNKAVKLEDSEFIVEQKL